MQRTRILYLIGSLLVIPQAATAEPQAAPPSVNAPAPVEAKREPVPSPAATQPAAPAPEQKAAAPGAKDKKGADKKAADKKEKKPKVLARDLFGKTQTAAALAPRSLGWYAKGCLSGGVHLADTGPDWQTMRLSRNRAWGHPKLIKLLKRLASESKQDGWTGLLVGDISQPRGGPMLTGHASHQVGLDADIWLTPMPNRVLTRQEREEIQATTMLDKTSLARRSEGVHAGPRRPYQARRIVSGGRAGVRQPGNQEGAVPGRRKGSRLARQSAPDLGPQLSLPHPHRLPQRRLRDATACLG